MDMGTGTMVAAIVAALATMLSVFLAWRSNKKQQELAKRANELQAENNQILAREKIFGWTDVEKYSNALFLQIEASGFIPDCIYTRTTRYDYSYNHSQQNERNYTDFFFHFCSWGC